MTDDEKFFAWLDGELAPAEAAEMEARIAADPALASLAEQHRSLGAKLKNTFEPISSEPVPERLKEALAPSADVIDFASARRRRLVPPMAQWSAIAATLAVGVFLGTMVPQRSNGPIEVEGGKIYAAAMLGDALDKELASAPSGNVRIGMTFRSRTGQICRTFTQSAAGGLACRSGDRWQIKGLFGAPEGQGGDYRMAGGMDPSLAALISSTMVGEPFDAAQEKAGQLRHWQ